MNQTIESKNKALVQEAFDTLSTSVTVRPPRSIGHRITSSIAPTSSPGRRHLLMSSESGANSASMKMRRRPGSMWALCWM